MGGRGVFILGLLMVCANCLFSQTHFDPGNMQLGFNYGMGTQNAFPFNSKNYTYDIRFYKGILNLGLDETVKWSFEANFELGYYKVKYHSESHANMKTVNRNLVDQQPVTDKQLNEYVLNVGLLSRYKFSDHFGIYALGSLGPMVSSCATDRQAHGFAFSDIFALGLRYPHSQWAFDLRFGVRHVSNAGFSRPNKGHNSTHLEAGFLVRL